MSSAGSALIPSFRYADAPAAVAWLESVLGMKTRALYPGPDNTIGHAELTFGTTGMIMLGSASNPRPHPHLWTTPSRIGGKVTSPMYLVVADGEPLWAAAQAAGAQIIQPLQTMPYGGKAFVLLDPEGYQWSVGEYDPWCTPQP